MSNVAFMSSSSDEGVYDPATDRLCFPSRLFAAMISNLRRILSHPLFTVMSPKGSPPIPVELHVKSSNSPRSCAGEVTLASPDAVPCMSKCFPIRGLSIEMSNLSILTESVSRESPDSPPEATMLCSPLLNSSLFTEMSFPFMKISEG